jgi:L-alanine-DL-glutamate epimerase-like enolase superfamily enzyme
LAAPLSISHTHVHSLRVSSGAEALVARVLSEDGTPGYGFTLNLDAAVARDMAAWDALGRKRGAPLCVLLGGARRHSVPILRDELPAIAPDWEELRRGILADRWRLLRIDPFAWGSVEWLQTIAAAAQASDLGIALLAPNAHPWEIGYCAALAATLPGEDARIIVRGAPPAAQIAVSEAPGVGVDWSLEPGFAALQWQRG